VPLPSRITSWFYWCYNANSDDTGGLVDSAWRNLMWTKINFLTSRLSLKPWYLD
jgi:hypothetical protein